MPGPQPPAVELPPALQQILEHLTRCYTKPYCLVLRAQIILEAATGANNTEVARRLGLEPDTVRTWRTRWLAAAPMLQAALGADSAAAEMTALVEATLSDAPRPGTPDTFSAEQRVQLVALACTDPRTTGREISHWTTRELAAAAQDRGIVTTISARQVGRILDEAELKPHLSRYWLNADSEDPETFATAVEQVCELYAQTPTLHEQGVVIVSTDEKTGIQAGERKHPSKPMQAGYVERREFEYIRHGTQCLIANFQVATGEIIAPSIGPTRTEADFVAHIRQTLATQPQATWIFIVDQLNTHQSESLVRLVIEQCALEIDAATLGIKGRSGILQSMSTRQIFLADADHRIRFVYTPKHTSWLNQIEIWFGILVRKLLKRASFASPEDLRQRILNFIGYFNKTMAKPFQWTYTGHPLTT